MRSFTRPGSSEVGYTSVDCYFLARTSMGYEVSLLEAQLAECGLLDEAVMPQVLAGLRRVAMSDRASVKVRFECLDLLNTASHWHVVPEVCGAAGIASRSGTTLASFSSASSGAGADAGTGTGAGACAGAGAGTDPVCKVADPSVTGGSEASGSRGSHLI